MDKTFKVTVTIESTHPDDCTERDVEDYVCWELLGRVHWMPDGDELQEIKVEEVKHG